MLRVMIPVMVLYVAVAGFALYEIITDTGWLGPGVMLGSLAIPAGFRFWINRNFPPPWGLAN